MTEVHNQLLALWQAQVIKERLIRTSLDGLVRTLRNCAHDGRTANFRKTWGVAKASTMQAFRAAGIFKRHAAKAPMSPMNALVSAADSELDGETRPAAPSVETPVLPPPKKSFADR